jgi:hypothetical protein
MDSKRYVEISDALTRLKRDYERSEGTMIATLNTNVGIALIEAIERLQQQLSVSVEDLNKGLANSVKILVESTKELAASNEKYKEYREARRAKRHARKKVRESTGAMR